MKSTRPVGKNINQEGNRKMKSLEDRELSEITFWRDNGHERPEADSIGNLINKMTDCAVFVDVIEKFSDCFRSSNTVLEIGGGQGWASCALKKIYPHLKVILTDISKYAIESKHKWERVFGVSIDKAYACKSYEIPEEDSSLDCIFCFAAAHHFADLDRTIEEIQRVLRSGGQCFFFHEPTTTPLFYRYVCARVNKKRPLVPEDVIIYKSLVKIAEHAGLKANVFFNPTLIKRGPVETVYYFVLSKFPILQRILPCTANFHFLKP
jgi:ubiquinone/menaquinone biosynthesis C-methylase UbiE